jgi:hypothetical protein
MFTAQQTFAKSSHKHSASAKKHHKKHNKKAMAVTTPGAASLSDSGS